MSGSSRRCTRGTSPIRPASIRRGTTSSPTTSRPSSRPVAKAAQRSRATPRRLPPSPCCRPPRAGEGARGHRRPGSGRQAKPARQGRREARARQAEAKNIPLRGVASKIVENMDASLTVPTATSVRAVPAKLLADNRIVINNHLARGRGGKVSFTHLIGYALVRAIGVHPEMNNSLRGRRRQAEHGRAAAREPRHRHRPVQARRLAHPRGAVDQGLRADGLPPVLAGLRGHRAPGPPQRADHGRLHRRDDLADQPRRHRHGALAAAADGRPERHHRRRRDGIPGAVPGHERRPSSPRWPSARSSR